VAGITATEIGRTIITTPPLVEVRMALLSGATAKSFVRTRDEVVLEVELESVKATVARTPSGITVEFRPQATHVEVPAPLVQETDLLAAMAAGPAATFAEVKSDVE
jgi:hypothetical protein